MSEKRVRVSVYLQGELQNFRNGYQAIKSY